MSDAPQIQWPYWITAETIQQTEAWLERRDLREQVARLSPAELRRLCRAVRGHWRTPESSVAPGYVELTDRLGQFLIPEYQPSWWVDIPVRQ